MASALSLLICFIIFFSSVSINIQAKKLGNTRLFNVVGYGAVADGKSDNTKAFINAWNDACTAYKGKSAVVIPVGKFLLGPVIFKGPCKGPIRFRVEGTLIALSDKSSLNYDHWITFQYLNNLVVHGGGTFDGSGPSAWPYNNCMKNSKCPTLPTSLRFDFVNNSGIRRITSLNSKNTHINLFACHYFKIKHVNIKAPSDSPNTDGIKMGDSTNIDISDSDIGTGDDCIAIVAKCQSLNITNLRCGPGHGISIGSLGRTPKEDVKDIFVRNCTLTNTDNGVRIKTWAVNSLPNNIYNAEFDNIRVINVENPILIDQQYCPSRKCDKNSQSQVQIKKVKFSNIWGTSKTQDAVNLLCSKSHPCQQVELNNINISYTGKHGESQTTSTCNNVYGLTNADPCKH